MHGWLEGNVTTRHAKYIQSIRQTISSRIQYDLLMAIALDTGGMDEPVVASYSDLAALAGCHRNSVGGHINQLVSAGFLRVGGTDQKRVYYLEGIVDEEYAVRNVEDESEANTHNRHNRHNIQRGIVTVGHSEPSQRLLEVAERLAQIVTELAQIVTVLATVTNEPSQRPEGHCDGYVEDPSIYNNINNNNNYYAPTVTNSTEACAEEAIKLFQQLTGLFPPHDSTDTFKDHWLAPAVAIVTQSKWDMALITQRIEAAVKIARGDNPQKKRYPIVSPKSLLTIALNWEPGVEQREAYNPVRMVKI